VRARGVIPALLLAIALSVPAAPALSWGTSGPGYGTHDWIIDDAVRVLDGRAGDWFDAAAARESSDDPDTVEVQPPGLYEHSYRASGSRGGAITRIADEFDIAQAAYAQGVAARDTGDPLAAADAFHDASWHIGLLSHFVGDIAQPFHSHKDAVGVDDLHHDYELLINNAQRSPDSTPGWRSPDRTVTAVTDIRRTAIATAGFSRRYYPELHRLLTTTGMVLTPRVAEITATVERRAAEDLADIIWSVEQGTGAAPQVGSLTAWISLTGVRAYGPNAIHVTAIDMSGRPIEGLRVTVAWPTPTGTKTLYLYTDGSGKQARYGGVGGTPRLVLRPVVASTTVRGVTQAARRAWTISPRLATGTAGFRTTTTTTTVAAGGTARVSSRCRDANGHPVPNLLVTWAWDLGATTRTTRAYTNAQGRAASSLVMPAATRAVTVTVRARTQAGSVTRTSSVSFRRTP
jgi:hypothetical protein